MKKFSFASLFLLFFSLEAFCQWLPMGGPEGGFVRTMAHTDNFVFASTAAGIHKSADQGKTWTLVDGLPPDWIPYQVKCSDELVIAWGVRNFNAYDWGEVYISKNEGMDWQYLPLPYQDFYYFDAFVSGQGIVVCINGFSWIWDEPSALWLPYAPLNNLGLYFSQFFENGDQIWAYSPNTVAKSNDRGAQWTSWTHLSMPTGDPFSAWGNGDTLFITRSTTNGFKTHRTVNKGLTWGSSLAHLGHYLIDVMEYQGVLYTHNNNNIFKSVNGGTIWEGVPLGYTRVHNLFHTPDALFVSISEGPLLRNAAPGIEGWQRSEQGMRGVELRSLSSNPAGLAVAADFAGVHYYDKASELWQSQGLLPPKFRADIVSSSSSRFLVAQSFGFRDSSIFRSDPNQSVWSPSTVVPEFPSTLDLDQIHCAENVCVAYNNTGFGSSTRLYSKDNGQSWDDDNFSGVWIKPYQGRFFSIQRDSVGLYASSDAKVWFPLGKTGLPTNDRMLNFFVLDEHLVLLTRAGAQDSINLYYSDDEGNSWAAAGKIRDYFYYNIQVLGNTQVMVMQGGDQGIKYSLDRGQTWLKFPKLPFNINYFYGSDDKNLYAYSQSEGELCKLPWDQIHFKDLSFRAFEDLNGNGVQDVGEPPVSDVQLYFPSTRELLASDSNGLANVTINIPPSSTELLKTAYPGSFSLQPAQIERSINDSDSIVLIPLTRKANTDLGLYLGQMKPLRKDSSCAILAIAKNTGGKSFAGGAALHFKLPDLPGSVQIEPLPNAINNDTLSWLLPALSIDSVFLVKVRFDAPAVFDESTNFQVKAWLDGLAFDEISRNNTADLIIFPTWAGTDDHWTFSNRYEVPVDEIKAGSGELIFSSGFENPYIYPSSNTEVQKVRFINDALDIDPASLRIIASSHPVRWGIDYSGKMGFELETGDLPLVAATGEATPCYVVYALNARKPTAQKGDLIAHSNQLRFNINNSTSSLSNNAIIQVTDAVDIAPEPPKPEAPSVHIQPSPSEGRFWVMPRGWEEQRAWLRITDAHGRQLQAQNWVLGQAIETELPSGTYFLHLEGEKGVVSAKFIVLRK
jgi:hypothetical protein